MKHAKTIAVLAAALCAVALPAQSTKPNSMVFVEGGTFQMGSKDDTFKDAAPVHTVTVDGFSMSRLKVTIDEWMNEIGAYPEGYEERRTGTRVPRMNWKTTAVENVTWYDAILYCNRRSVSEGLTPCYASNGSKDAITYSKQYRVEFPNVTCDWEADGYRLPTEAEWEYAARGGKKQKAYKYSGSDDAVKAKTAKTADGIEQMGAGRSEWCWDWYSSTYYAASGNNSNPHGPDYGESMFSSGGQYGGKVSCRVLRGGENSDLHTAFPVYLRRYLNPAEYEGLVGPDPCSFRIVRKAKNADGKKNSIVHRNIEVKIDGVSYYYFMTDDYDALRTELASHNCRAPASSDLWGNPVLAQSVRDKMQELGVRWSITVSSGRGILNYYTPNEKPRSVLLKDLQLK